MSSVYKYNFNNIRLVMTSTLSKVTTGESLPSETLIAWTDPAFPAFVEAPTIHPINMVTEVRFHIYDLNQHRISIFKKIVPKPS